ncbi:MAG: DMT family transporter [Candidatus Poseidoniaceae archaeon]|nr:DMT family transporter [Candidatus Poseidoniaceae archaeon]
MDRARPSVLTWIILGAALLGVSSGGALLQSFGDVPPLLRASWRLQATTVLLLPLAVLDWQREGAPWTTREEARGDAMLLVASGVFLALHFGAWTASLDRTTLTHSLLFVTAHPLVVLVGSAVLLALGRDIIPPGRRGWAGGLLGLTGAALTLLDVGEASGGQEVTLFGDVLAFLGAVFVVGYLAAGRVLRARWPVFLYAAVVTGLASVLLAVGSGAAETGAIAGHGIVGWLGPDWLAGFLLLAFLAGLVGHTGLNHCLKTMTPLTISVTLTLEPVVGSIIGLVAFGTGVPGPATLLGGLVMLCGLLLVVSNPSQDMADDADEPALA